MTNSICLCIDCEWTGPQAQVTMKWGVRRCPECKGRRVEVRTHSELVQAIAAQPVDDTDREQVIHDLDRAANADGLNQAGWAGSLG